MMKRTTGVLAVLAAGVVCADVTSTWQGGSSSVTPITAADWNDPDNWDANGVPNGTSAWADFGSQTGVFYVKSDVPVTVYHKLAQYAAGLTYVSDKTFTLCNNVQPNSYGGHIYAPFDFHNPANRQTYVSQTRFCDVVTSSVALGGLFCGRSYFHLDRFANVPGSTRQESFAFKVCGYNSSFDLFAPESSATDVTCAFDQVEGSAFLKRIGGTAATVLSVGTAVSGAGIRPGTFLRRVFPGKDWIELSQPVTISAEGNELTLAAFTADLTVNVQSFVPNGAEMANRFRPCKYRPEDRVIVDVGSFGILPRGVSDRPIVIDVPYGKFLTDQSTVTDVSAARIDIPYETIVYPATVVVHGSGTEENGNVQLGACDILFSDNPEADGVPGFARGIVRQVPQVERKDSDGVVYPFEESKLTVTGSMTAVIRKLTGIWSTLAKCGSGTLVVGIDEARAVTGTLAVREGTLTIAEPDGAYSCVASDGPVEISNLELAAGATFAVPSRGVRVLASCTMAPGATLAGEGVIELPGGVDLTGVNFSGNVRLPLGGAKLMGTAASACVPGDPAFWVDCSQTNTMTLSDTDGVLRIDDVRKKTDADVYNYSTNVAGTSFMPRLHYDEISQKHFVFFLGNKSSWGTDPTMSDTHFWARKVTSIKAVFQIMSMLRDGTAEANCYLVPMKRGGGFLGHSESGYNVWGRYSTDYTKPFTEKQWDKYRMMQDGRWFVNGSLESVGLDAGYAYPSYIADGRKIRLVPETVVYQPKVGSTSFPEADSYEYNRGYQNNNKNGNKILCELIVYTNEVSDAERVMITSYLMKKWQNAEVITKDFQSDGGSLGSFGGSSRIAFDTPTDVGMVVDAISEDATFAKYGDGRIRVDKVTGTGASIEVLGGSLEIESKTLDRLPVTDGLFAHFDADDESTVVCEEGKVMALKDVRGETVRIAALDASSTVAPTLVAKSSLGGKKVVDFGVATRTACASVDWTRSPALILPADQRSERVRTVISLLGSENGGGNLVGGATGPDSGWSTRYTFARAGSSAEVIGGTASAAIVDDKMAIPYTCQIARGADLRVNEMACDPLQTGLSGAFDIVAFSGFEAVGMGGLSGVYGDGAYHVGGEQFGEYIAYERKLAPDEIKDVEAYLKKKWLGVDTPGYGVATLKSLTVSSGATLKVTGNAPVSVAELVCKGGTVDGEVSLAEDVVIEACVDDQGSVGSIEVSGTVDLPRAGVVRFTGNTASLQPGEYLLLAAGAPLDMVAGWTIDATQVKARYVYALSIRDGNLYVSVVRPGMVIMVR